MATLNELCVKYKSDKCIKNIKNNEDILHNFCSFYEPYFKQIKHHCQEMNRPVNILEVGVLNGGSLKAYRDYFENNVNIIGLDIEDKSKLNGNNIKTYVCDQGDPAKLIDLLNNLNMSFDIIIDDGSHLWSHEIFTLLILSNYVKREVGIYILEDLHTSYSPNYNDIDKEFNIINSPLFFLNFYNLMDEFFIGENAKYKDYEEVYNIFRNSVNNITIKNFGSYKQNNINRYSVTSIINFR